jgi:signal transduction histidine kinase
VTDRQAPAVLSALPFVDLHRVALPQDGLLIPLPDACRRNFARSTKCKEHYEALAKRSAGSVVQCPFGFATYPIFRDPLRIAFTGFVPFPRRGGEAERALAKRYPQHHVAEASLKKAADAVLSAVDRLGQLETEAVKGHSMALHEIRKLNRSVKQTAERLCRDQDAEDPEAASPELVRIWKAAELMSQQFDVIEILANESLASLPLNSTTTLYKLVDKCVRIYRPAGNRRRIGLTAPRGYSPLIEVCDKTIPIIPTVLIENALKYSPISTDISVSLRPADDRCVFEVANLTAENADLTSRVFERGVRASSDTDGSGTGLYVAQLVARQHGSEITVHTDSAGQGMLRCVFAVSFRVVK